MQNIIREEIDKKDILFQQLFIDHQIQLRQNPLYISHEAFRDVKILFELYSQTYHLKGFNYNHLNKNKVLQILNPFSVSQKKELLEFLIESLTKDGNNQHADDFKQCLKRLQIVCCFNEIKEKKCIIKNVLLLVQKTSSYNLLALMICIFSYVLFCVLIYSPAPYEWMKVFEVKNAFFCKNSFLNQLSNVVLYTFDFDDTMEIMPINFIGVLLMVILKCFFVLVIVNFIIREIIAKIKL